MNSLNLPPLALSAHPGGSRVGQSAVRLATCTGRCGGALGLTPSAVHGSGRCMWLMLGGWPCRDDERFRRTSTTE